MNSTSNSLSGSSAMSASTNIPPRETLRDHAQRSLSVRGEAHLGLERHALEAAHGEAQEALRHLEQRHAAQRLRDHAVGARAHRALVLLGRVSARHHDHGDVTQIGVVADLAAQLVAVHLAHREIGQHEIGPLALRDLERLGAVARGQDPAGPAQEDRLDLAEHRRVVDHEDLRARLPGRLRLRDRGGALGHG